jgi:hypothetical protein
MEEGVDVKLKNSSRFYKTITISGVKRSIPPNGVFEVDENFNIDINDWATKTDEEINIKDIVKPKHNDDIAELRKDLKRLEELIQNTILKRQEILKNAITDISDSLENLEKYIYEGKHEDSVPVVLEEENKKINGIDDLLKGQKNGRS